MKNRRWIDRGRFGHARVFESDELRAIVSRDEGRWHLSLSCPDRYPNWDELADARYDLVPHECDMAMILPPPSDYVNAHHFVLQLHEVRDTGMMVDRGGNQLRTRETLGGAPGRETEPHPWDHMKEVRT